MKLRSILSSVVLVGLAAAPASADVQTLYGYEDAEVQTSFNLSFPELGIDSSSQVFYTRFTLEIDEEAGTARFSSYEQEIEPLLLPLGISTGSLRVRIASSEGTLNAGGQTFTTNDDYNITFTNDLTFFGFESPVILPSVSEGQFTTAADGSRIVEMTWQGEGELENSENPSEPYKYTYSCRVRSKTTESVDSIPPLPTRDACGAGVMSLFGLFGLGFVGRSRIRRRR